MSQVLGRRATVVDIADAAAATVGVAVSAIAGHSGWTTAAQLPTSRQTLILFEDDEHPNSSVHNQHATYTIGKHRQPAA